MTKRIISFSGRKSSGKTLLCELTQKYGYTLLNFADEIKTVACKIFGIDLTFLNNMKDINLSSRNTFDFSFIFTKKDILLLSSLIDIPNILVGEVFQENSKLISIRDFLQKLGTNLIREFNPDWHVNKMRLKINNGEKFCISDTRFLNEKNLIKEFNGECWFIIRPDYNEVSNHQSEISLNWTNFNENNIIINNKDQLYLKQHWKIYMEKDIYTFNKYPIDYTYLNEPPRKNLREKRANFMLGQTHSCPEFNTKETENKMDECNPFLLENLKKWAH